MHKWNLSFAFPAMRERIQVGLENMGFGYFSEAEASEVAFLRARRHPNCYNISIWADAHQLAGKVFVGKSSPLARWGCRHGLSIFPLWARSKSGERSLALPAPNHPDA